MAHQKGREKKKARVAPDRHLAANGIAGEKKEIEAGGGDTANCADASMLFAWREKNAAELLT